MAKLLIPATPEARTKKSVINKMLADAVINNSHDLQVDDNEFTLFLDTKEMALYITCKADITTDDEATLIQNVEAYEMLIDDGEINFDIETNYIERFTNLTDIAKKVIDKFECNNGVYLLDDWQVASDMMQEIREEARDSEEYSRDTMSYFGMCNADFA